MTKILDFQKAHLRKHGKMIFPRWTPTKVPPPKPLELKDLDKVFGDLLLDAVSEPDTERWKSLKEIYEI